MSRTPLSLDTSPEVEEMLINAWREMTPEQKGAIMTGLTRATFALARAGVRDRYPDASPEEQRLRLAILILGEELAHKAYPESATLVP